MLKLLIGLLFAAVVISLAAGLLFLLKPKSESASARLLISLKFRIGLAVLLLAVLVWGFATGALYSQAPW